MEDNSVPKIEIDPKKCTKKGLCVQVCPWVYDQASPDDFPRVADPLACNLCGHCVAICPTGAISHSGMNMGNFPRIERGMEFDADRLLAFLRRRRSYRNFDQRRRVKREVIEKMIEAARYSPTGSNAQTLVHVVVQDRDTITGLTRLCVQAFRERYTMAQDKELLACMAPGEAKQMQDWRFIFKDVVEASDRGEDRLFYHAPGLIISHAPREATSCPLEDATLASFHMILIAESMGLGTCYIGNFYETVNENTEIRKMLNVPPANDILMCFAFGYPAVRFTRLVDRRPPQVHWIGSE